MLLGTSVLTWSVVSGDAIAQNCDRFASANQNISAAEVTPSMSSATVVNCGPNRDFGASYFSVDNNFTLNLLGNTNVSSAAKAGGSFATSAAVAINNQATDAGFTNPNVIVNIDASAKITSTQTMAGLSVDLIQVGLGQRGNIGNGSIAVSNAGAITTSGTYGLLATANYGSVTVTNSGSISSPSVGMLFYSQFGTTTLTNSGTISGNNALQAFGGAGLTINNRGTGIIMSDSLAVSGQSAGRTVINNEGLIVGDISLNYRNNDLSNTFNNSGRFNTFTGGSIGGAFVNTGVFALAGSSANAVAASLSGVSTFTNGGTIDLRNGSAGNGLTIGGNYVGNNGSLLLQASTQNGTSDRLIITGNASGTTGVSVTNLTPNVAFTTSPTLVQVNGTITPGAFTLSGTQGFGTLQPMLITSTNTVSLGGTVPAPIPNAIVTLTPTVTPTPTPTVTPTPTETGMAAPSTVVVAAVPNAVALSGPTAAIASRTIAQQGSSAVLDRVQQLRDTKQTGTVGASGSSLLSYAPTGYAALVTKDPILQGTVPRPAPADESVRFATWARATGDLERRTGTTNFSFAGLSSTRDLGYSQQTGALLGGADAIISGVSSADDAVILGVLGGYTTATVSLNQNAGTQAYDGGTVGAYATYLKGPIFVDALFKVDLLGLDIIAPGIRQTTGLKNYSFATNIGYRFPMDNGVYIEPTAGLDYATTSFDRQTSLTSATVPLRDGDALRGRIGTRVGSEVVIDNIRVEPSVTAYAYTVLSESNPSGVVNGVTSVTGLRDQGKARGEVQASLNVFNLKSGVSGFVRADMRVGGDLIAGGGRIGARYQW